jgi:glycosyltransferase involved in cell wall biosynthesis
VIDMPLISVIVPVYNHEKYVVECLNSIRDSHYRPLELIIIDDGSTDRSGELVAAWLQDNGHFFVRTVHQQQENVGVCRTLNRLVSLARGEIIVLVASDDVLLPAGISLRVAHLQAHPQLLAVFGDAAMIDGNGAIICREFEKNVKKGNKKALADPRFIARELILKWSVPGPVFAAWRKTFDPVLGVGPYDESLLLEDRDMYLRLLARRALGYIPDEVALYRCIQQSLSQAPERNIALRRSLLQCEQNAYARFRGLEKLFLKLEVLRNLAEIRYLSDKTSSARFLGTKLMKVAVELTYRLHKAAFYCVLILELPFRQRAASRDKG